MNELNFRQLIEDYVTGRLTGPRLQEFFRLLEEEPNRKILEECLREEWAQPVDGEMQNEDVQNRIEAIVMNRIRMQEPVSSDPIMMKTRRISWSIKLAAAAVVLLVLSFAAIRLFSHQRQELAKVPVKSQMINDVLPGGDKAILTLDDGRKIVLDTASNGELMVQGGTRLIKEGARIRYDKEAETVKVYYNTITTPRGGQYRLELADGTRVWLNAASSLRFPSSFLGKDRQVELTGEGYFEVAHDASKPFHVQVNGMDVQVLGTHFNINSYADEPSVKTTLLEGRLKVKDGANYVFLNPGQQAIVAGENQSIRIINGVDLDEVVAWKNGKFEFNNSTVETVMRQLSRWYDVDIEYLGSRPDIHFVGSISRTENISEVLHMLEQTKAVRFQIKQRTIQVMK